MNARGRGAVAFRGGRGGRSGGGAGFGRGQSRGRGGHSFRGGADAPMKRVVKSLDNNNNNNNNNNNGLTSAGSTHTTPGKQFTSQQQQQRHVVTTVTDNGTELPKKLNNKVFIDGLPYENKTGDGSSVEDELMQFATAWRVGKPIRLIKKDGQGFGFLVFFSPHSVDVAVRVLNGRKFLGRTLRVALPKEKNGITDTMNNGGDADGKGSYSRQVLLSDLAKITQAEIIREILRDVAPQLEKRLESVKLTSNNRKAFLTFMSNEDVEPAVKFLDGLSMLGRRIAASPAAAPGTLPYSKRANKNTPLTGRDADGTTTKESSDHDNNDDYENNDENDVAPVVPLGMEAPPTRQAVKRTEQTATRKEGKPSNVTGVTEKYNLLDNGPAEVFVGNLGDEVTEAQLRSHFSACGKITECEIMVNKSTRLPTGIARIVFALPAYAAYAQKHLHGSRLHGHILRVDRGEEPSAPLMSELAPNDDEEEEIDEDGYMEHYGVKDKAAYFKGTSLEEGRKGKVKGKEKGDKKISSSSGGDSSNSNSNSKDKNSKRVRETMVDSTEKKKSKKENTEGDFVVSASFPASGAFDDDDDDEEEHFHDVDDVDEPVKSNAARRGVKKGKSGGSMKQKVKKTTKAKKSSK
ncbi:putative nuclear cap binding protein [Trypanosoma theileri]|uniref:Putative nuclear cap binding protein n=1 Tax=Trypanosoma theileri TaxID=67003 RepID=A0A1X0NZL9_9TRYP|nr:putative nuclear cap binding protein [Trypanosoma theileri]ORC90122.1 putative nuclear cap binding protein [Trypanosoma theileri]